ncbi:[NiFe]-hydrogenase assembly chaperone HybE [Thiorhodococcus mannitoliphagus]|uniref:[NiFe]-hydrogenase assembly chaperone HybE n=1 Tax=Thiorhodococcus mannitoliphagus TaxID=329406 RepID=A0A6P1DW19_9GAMM|nr:[NiFe]-hydrogenase assembly chaperone HybE [Thiorhodococcus mannitoliphagus]NEX21889.1 [NiFe]-hydrogenase assembly chaperone HybE [Thiorhodococcus mannitoliphagus]
MTPLDLEPEDIARRLAAAFQRVHAERMSGLPILNPNLSVQVVGGRMLDGDWIGVLITPWCMNLVLVPGPESANHPGSVGVKQRVALPAGEVETIGSEEADIGPFAACSLYSPMGGFADQGSAVAAAEEILSAVFTPAQQASDAPAAAAPAKVGVSRRGLLRGAFLRD